MLTQKRLYEIAIKIEVTGTMFYHKAAALISHDALKPLFIALSKEEAKHEEIFKGMLKNLDEKNENLNLENALTQDIDTFDSQIFNIFKIEEILKSTYDLLNIIDFAIEQENKTIKYYENIKPIVSIKNRTTMDILINEEKKHFSELITIRSKAITLNNLKDKSLLRSNSKEKG